MRQLQICNFVSFKNVTQKHGQGYFYMIEAKSERKQEGIQSQGCGTVKNLFKNNLGADDSFIYFL